MATRILIAEVRTQVTDQLSSTLQGHGYDVLTTADGADALRMVRSERPDIVILDRELPHLGGIRVCKRIRSEPRTAETPIMILSSNVENGDRVRALNAGADDYLSEPLDMEEFLARVNAMQRRQSGNASARILAAGIIEMDLDRWIVSVGGEPVSLTMKEFGLLRVLIESKGRVLTRDMLLSKIWGVDNVRGFNTRTVDVHVGRLRRKLRSAGDLILTVRNVGYRMDVSPEWIRRTAN